MEMSATWGEAEIGEARVVASRKDMVVPGTTATWAVEAIGARVDSVVVVIQKKKAMVE
jgi:hypothetical protein